MKIARREFPHLAAGAFPATLRIARAPAYPLQPVRIPLPDPTIRRSINACQG
jgi:hypothetical protein